MENEEKNIEEISSENKEQALESFEEDSSILADSLDENPQKLETEAKEKTIVEQLKEQDEFSFLDNEEPLHEKNEENSQELITVRPIKFQEFESKAPNRAIKKNLDILQDVSMHISVELGRTKSSIKEIIGFEAGSIVELDKIAGEQVEVFVNDKLIAKGEVIVIEDKFGVRITSTNIQKQI